MKKMLNEIKEQIIHYELFYEISLEEAKSEVEKIYEKEFRFIPFGKQLSKLFVNGEYNKVNILREQQNIKEKKRCE